MELCKGAGFHKAESVRTGRTIHNFFEVDALPQLLTNYDGRLSELFAVQGQRFPAPRVPSLISHQVTAKGCSFQVTVCRKQAAFQITPCPTQLLTSCPGQHSTEVCTPLVQKGHPLFWTQDCFTLGLATFFQNSKLFRISDIVKITLKMYGCFALIVGYLYSLTLIQSGIAERPLQYKKAKYI